MDVRSPDNWTLPRGDEAAIPQEFLVVQNILPTAASGKLQAAMSRIAFVVRSWTIPNRHLHRP